MQGSIKYRANAGKVLSRWRVFSFPALVAVKNKNQHAQISLNWRNCGCRPFAWRCRIRLHEPQFGNRCCNQSVKQFNSSKTTFINMNKTHLLIFIGAAIAGYYFAPTLAGSTIPGVGTVFNKVYSLGQNA